MNRDEAKRILLLYRPDTADAADPEVAEALELAQRDPELRQWWERQAAFHSAMRGKFAELRVPEDLKEAILDGRKVVRLVFRRVPPVWLAAAAAIALFIGIAAVWLQRPPLERFGFYRAHIVSTALREYRMDIKTNDLSQIRGYLAASGAPTNYVLPQKLERLSATGAARLSWNNRPVSMVCFDRGDRNMLFLFVIDRTALRSAPPTTPKLEKVNRLQTASWTRGGNIYVLAGPDEPQFLEKYGPQPGAPQ